MGSKKIEKASCRDVCLVAPPSKAHTLRALMLAALADGCSRIDKPLLAGDQLNLINCLRELGVGVEVGADGESVQVQGCAGKFRPTGKELNVGESGVSMNLLVSAASLASGPVVLTGAERITERPIAQVVEGTRQLGGKISYLRTDGFPPIKLAGTGLEGGSARMSGAITSQYFSSLAISAPCAGNPVILCCDDSMTEKPYFDISLQMMSEFGVEVQRDGYSETRIPNSGYKARDIQVEGDYSSSSFFFLAAAVLGGKVKVEGLSASTVQGDRAFLDLLETMGCDIWCSGLTVSVEGGPLSGIQIDMGDIPDLVPPAAIAAAFAEGVSTFNNVGQLRYKECDRLAVMVSELAKMGVAASCDEDSLTVTGVGLEKMRGAKIDPHNDHRIAMSFAIAGLAVGNQEIENPACVGKSFPDFWERIAPVWGE